jgi:hypothetical protein
LRTSKSNYERNKTPSRINTNIILDKSGVKNREDSLKRNLSKSNHKGNKSLSKQRNSVRNTKKNESSPESKPRI